MSKSFKQENDRRRYPRFAVSAGGLIHGEDGIVSPCVVENLSSGVY